MFIAEYVQSGKLVRVYSENGKKIVTREKYIKGTYNIPNGYIPWKRERYYGEEESKDHKDHPDKEGCL